MKYCPACNRDFADASSLCEQDGTVLVEESWQAIVARSLKADPGSSPLDLKTVLPELQNQDVIQTRRAARPAIKRIRWIAAAVSVVICVAVCFAAYRLLRNSSEKKLDQAIARGDLLTPPGTSAYDLYHQLKREGAGSDKLKKFEDKLLPLLTLRPQQLLEEFSQVGAKEPAQQEWGDAAKLLSWASEISPNDSLINAQATYCSGRLAYLLGRKDEALSAWKHSLDLDSSWAMPSNSIGLLYSERKEFQKARVHLLEAARRNPNWAVPYNHLGTAHFYQKRYEPAIKYYNQAVAKDPHWAQPHAWLATIAMQQKQYAVAILEFEKVLDPAATGPGAINFKQIREQLENARQLLKNLEESEQANAQ
jgi:tetratricopeptide (TPR) repeat protein